MSLPPLYEIGGVSTCPLGMPMNQNRLAVPMWSYAMEKYPPQRIIELGTYNGGFTIALGLHAWNIGCQIDTYDRMEAPSVAFRPIAQALGIRFHQGDIWEQIPDIIELIRQPGVSYVLCDGGDKAREVQTLAPHLKVGDVIAAHDYMPPGKHDTGCGSEIYVKDVPARACDLEPFYQEHFDHAAWLAYRKIR